MIPIRVVNANCIPFEQPFPLKWLFRWLLSMWKRAHTFYHVKMMCHTDVVNGRNNNSSNNNKTWYWFSALCVGGWYKVWIENLSFLLPCTLATLKSSPLWFYPSFAYTPNSVTALPDQLWNTLCAFTPIFRDKNILFMLLCTYRSNGRPISMCVCWPCVRAILVFDGLYIS